MAVRSSASHEAAAVPSLRERLEAGAARVPFRLKLGVVYAVIAIIAAWLIVLFRFDWPFMAQWLPFLLRGVPLTLFICAAGIALSVPLALLGALGRLSSNAVFYGISNFYVSFIRGSPLIVQIFFIYFGLPQIAFSPSVPPWLSRFLIFPVVVAGILALGINYGAYMTEIFRAGIQSVGHGQIEAAHALGMGRGQTMRRIVLPQAIRVIIPPTGNDFIAMLKDSSLVGLAGTPELFFRATNLGRSQLHGFEAFAVAALIYWVLTIVFSFFQKRLEDRMGKGYVRESYEAPGRYGSAH
jgi:polar amino acid transport system permease protein